MKVRHATREDLAIANGWLVARGLPMVATELVAPHGYVVDELAAVWLYPLVGVPMAMLEHLVTNPRAGKDERNEALDAVVAEALRDATTRLGVRVVFSLTTTPAVVARAKRHGFVVLREAATLLVADAGGS